MENIKNVIEFEKKERGRQENYDKCIMHSTFTWKIVCGLIHVAFVNTQKLIIYSNNNLQKLKNDLP